MLAYGILEPGQYGNKWNGLIEPDGIVTAAFESSSSDMVLSFDAYDVDSNIEIEVLLNGASLGYLAKGINEGLTHYEISIAAGLQQPGTNEIVFRQAEDLNFVWGVSNVLIDTKPEGYVPSDPLYAQEWHLAALGDIERVWVDYSRELVSM